MAALWWKECPPVDATRDLRRSTDLCGHCGHTRFLHLGPKTGFSERLGPCMAGECDCRVGHDWRHAVCRATS